MTGKRSFRRVDGDGLQGGAGGGEMGLVEVTRSLESDDSEEVLALP